MRLALLISIAFFSAASVAKNDCEVNILSNRQMMVFRMRSERSFEPKSILVRGNRYMLIRELGRSASTVYLAIDPDGNKVIVKDYDLKVNGPSSRQSHFFLREFVVTKFLRAHRVSVPRILDYAETEGLVVKEYAEGLLPWEFRSRGIRTFGVSPEEFANINSQLRSLIEHLQSLNPAFANWIDRNAVAAIPRSLARNLSASSIVRQIRPRHIDAREDNFVYNFENERWILFDP